MRILLLKPPNRGFSHQLWRHFPVGPAYLSAVLQKAGHEVTLFDAMAYREESHVITEYLNSVEAQKVSLHPRWKHLLHWGATWEHIEEVVRREKPDLIGISCMFSCYHLSAHKVAETAKRVWPDVPVVIGGSHATVLYEKVLSDRNIDIAVLGEAEDTVLPLVERLASKQRLQDLEGLAFRCGDGHCDCATVGALHVKPKTSWRTDLDDLPSPAIATVEWPRYNGTMTLITSRGCPFSCSFCSVHATVGRKFRARDSVKVVDEIERYAAQGVARFTIEDDNFTFSIPRVVAICDEVIRRGLNVELHLPNGITSLDLDVELIRKMSAAGFRGLFMGLETTDPNILKDIAKGFTSLEAVVEAAKRFETAGVMAWGSLIIGLPKQDLRAVALDVTNLLGRGVQTTSNPFFPIPGAPDFRRALEAGVMTADTDLALLEGDAYNRTFDISSATAYWATIAVQSFNLAYPVIVQARKLARESKHLPHPVRALNEALAGKVATRSKAPVFVEVDGKVRVVQPVASCFCGGNALRPGSSHGKVCTKVGDTAALVMSFVFGRTVSFVETECAVESGGDHCVFDLVDEALPEADEVVQAFLTAVDEVLDTPRAFPKRKKPNPLRVVEPAG